MAVSKLIYSKSDHVNTYWMVGKFRLCLSKREMSVKYLGYKDKNARDTNKSYEDVRELILPIDPNDKDLVDYEELIINYGNEDHMEISIELEMKVDLKTVIAPNITKIIDKLIGYGYYGLKITDEFRNAKDI